MGKSKATPICPYIFHLYQAHELLLTAEKKEYRIQEALVKHNVEPEEDDDPASPVNPDERESSDDSVCETSRPVRSERFRSRRRLGSRNHRSTGGNNRQRQRIRSSGRAQHQGMQWMR